MYYTLEGNRTMKRTLSLIFGFLLAFITVSCTSGKQPSFTPETVSSAQSNPVSAPTNPPAASKHVSPASLPQICNCVLRFDHISIEHGLSQSSVQVIFQDHRGFLWFGTEDGLNRYDGYNFKIYKPDPDASNSLSDRWITSIVEDQEGYLWIATANGLDLFERTTGNFKHYIYSPSQQEGISGKSITALYEDSRGRFWVGTA